MTREEAIKLLVNATYSDEWQGNEDLTTAHNMAIKALEQEPRWIPVSERLPEEREWIGTKRFGTTISDEVYVTLETSDGERFTKHLSFQNGELSVIDQETMELWFKGAVPIAWMPLPKPYKAESEE